MWGTLDVKEVQRKLRTNIYGGLTEEEVQNRKKQFGANKLEEGKKESLFIKFIKQFNDFMIITLIIASGISAAISYIQKTNDYIDSIIIVAIVILNATVGVIQENKAEKSIEALNKLTAPKAKVKRNNILKTIDSKELVPGDVIVVETGDYVPADCRLINSYNLKAEESALTGENLPVSKDANCIIGENVAVGDMQNLIFATTMIVNGHAEAIVTETGMNTKVGKIAGMIIKDEAPETPLQKRLGDVGKKLGIVALLICVLIFFIGIIKRIPVMEIFMTSVGLAVAAIPEGLPAVVTIMLSIGVTKMAKKNSIIRKLPAVETLGSSNVICSDKTGTLTQNKMRVVEIIGLDSNPLRKKEILEMACMCTDCSINSSTKEVDGEATEKAIVEAAMEVGIDKNELYSRMHRINDIPFDSERKMMTTIHKVGNKYRVITKGAPEVLLKRCDKYLEKNRELNITSTNIQKASLFNEQMAEKALRVIAVAYKDLEELPDNINTNIEKNLTFVGLIGMIDPPRDGVKEAISICKHAGIKTVMITGDHILTAKAIAGKLGILKTGDLAITGKELDEIPNEEFEKNIIRYSVFARVSPEHKVKIVKAFRKNGNVVAMTGDGVNDAPALKNADIGIAMGKTGTDVAKNASDMILADDNFVTIVEAVKEGRHIYDNIKKAVHFLLATNIGEIVAIFVGLLMGLDTPLLAIQLLWINLVTDSLPAIALGLEPIDKNIMNKKPKKSNESFFAGGLWGSIFVEGMMIGILTLFAFAIGNNKYGIEVGRTMAFFTLSALELIHSINVRSDESIFKIGIFSNIYLVGAFIIGIMLQFLVIAIPGLASIFESVPLNLTQWLYVAIISILPFIIIETQKKINEFKFGKVVYSTRELFDAKQKTSNKC